MLASTLEGHCEVDPVPILIQRITEIIPLKALCEPRVRSVLHGIP